MTEGVKGKLETFKELLKTHGAKTFSNLLTAFMIWLFGNLVFIPLAASINRQTLIFCSLIFFLAFTILVATALPGLKKLIDAFSIFSARKYSRKKKLNYEHSLVLFRHLSYIISIIILYLLYLPFLGNLHPAVSGIVLILVLIWIFFLTIRILLIFSRKIFQWLYTP